MPCGKNNAELAYCKARFATSNVQTRNRAGHKRKLQIKTPATKSTVTLIDFQTREVFEVFGLQMKEKHLLSQHQLILKAIRFILKQERKNPVLATILIRE